MRARLPLRRPAGVFANLVASLVARRVAAFSAALLPTLLTVLLAAHGPAWAHVSGYTDSSVQISRSGVRVIFTLPTDNLLELDRRGSANGPPLPVAGAKPGDPDSYLARVRDGWQVSAGGQRCLLTQARGRALPQLPSYQYQFTWVCPQGLDAVSLRYQLFFAAWPEHENFVRVFLADQRMRQRFLAVRQQIDVPVGQLLAQWGKPLAAGFFDADPNRDLGNVLGARDDAAVPRVLPSQPSLGSLRWAQLDAGFIHLGWQHIFMGLDHVLFVVGLALLHRDWRRLLVLVSAFTAAHTLTLALSTLGTLSVPPAVAEPLIALTIVYIGLENLRALWRRQGPGRSAAGAPAEDPGGAVGKQTGWFSKALGAQAVLVFGFGLVHGVGFSEVLRAMGLAEDMLGALLMFNLGVELGQLALLAGVLPLILLARRLHIERGVGATVSLAIAGAGLVLLAQRI